MLEGGTQQGSGSGEDRQARSDADAVRAARIAADATRYAAERQVDAARINAAGVREAAEITARGARWAAVAAALIMPAVALFKPADGGSPAQCGSPMAAVVRDSGAGPSAARRPARPRSRP